MEELDKLEYNGYIIGGSWTNDTCRTLPACFRPASQRLASGLFNQATTYQFNMTSVLPTGSVSTDSDPRIACATWQASEINPDSR